MVIIYLEGCNNPSLFIGGKGMNFKRRYESQKRRNASLLERNESLRIQNENLRRKNELLYDEIELYKYQMQSIEEIKNEYMNGLEELREARDCYKEAIREAQIIKSEYSKKFKKVVKNLSRQI